AEHDLDHGPQPAHRAAEGGAGQGKLRDRSVEHARRTVLLEQTARDGEHSAGGGDILPEEDDALVLGERLVQGLADRGAELEGCHQCSLSVTPAASAAARAW